jgi:type VI secretion system protein ImpH
VTFLRNLEAEPWRFDYFSVLRALERSFKDKPRIGEAATIRDEFVELGQNPFMDFPASNISGAVQEDGKPLRLFVKFLGLLGPQGALPLSTTEEAYHYFLANDDAFPRFLDIFNHRFLQLFFRAWSDARPIAQHDRPEADRFIAYLGSAIGTGSAPYRGLDSIPDAVKMGFAGLLGAQSRSAARLVGAIRGMFNVEAAIEECVGLRLAIDPAEQTRLGQAGSRLGVDAMVGATIYSVQDKFRIRIYTNSLKQYMRFLPSGDLCELVADLVFFYNGEQLDWDVELALPAAEAPPVRVGQSGQLGWTTWMSPDVTAPQPYRSDARFHPAERMKHKREQMAKQSGTEGNHNGRNQP